MLLSPRRRWISGTEAEVSPSDVQGSACKAAILMGSPPSAASPSCLTPEIFTGCPPVPPSPRLQGELALKNQELAVATREAEKLLGEISESTAMAEKEKHKVAVIVEAVSKKVGAEGARRLGRAARETGASHSERHAAVVGCEWPGAQAVATHPPAPLHPPSDRPPARTAPQAEEIAAVKLDAERDLAEAKPALDAALAALNSITPKDIGALKALKNPPDVIKRIFDCVLLLRWGPGLRGGGEPGGVTARRV